MNDAESQMRELLHKADPLLTAPADRVAEVGARVRHTRQKNLLGVCLSALLIMAVAFVVWPHQTRIMPVLGANGCPTERFDGPWKGDGEGRLVPDEAMSVTLCEGTNGPPRTLTSGVGEMTTLLNNLPPSGESTQCADTGKPALSLVLKYPQRPPVIALLDVRCGQIYVDGQVRSARPSPADTFQTLYRQQITEARPLMIPQCASEMHGADLRYSGLRDDMADLRGAGDPFVHSELWALTACEYTGSPTTTWTRGKQATQYQVLSAWRDRINNVAATPHVECRGEDPPSQLYVVWIVDVTGSVSELVITKGPCFAVYAADFGGWELSSKLMTEIEYLIGNR